MQRQRTRHKKYKKKAAADGRSDGRIDGGRRDRDKSIAGERALVRPRPAGAAIIRSRRGSRSSSDHFSASITRRPVFVRSLGRAPSLSCDCRLAARERQRQGPVEPRDRRLGFRNSSCRFATVEHVRRRYTIANLRTKHGERRAAGP